VLNVAKSAMFGSQTVAVKIDDLSVPASARSASILPSTCDAWASMLTDRSSVLGREIDKAIMDRGHAEPLSGPNRLIMTPPASGCRSRHAKCFADRAI